MKIQHLMFAISIATLTACGTATNENNEHNHSHATETHEHEGHNHENCTHNHEAHNHNHAEAGHTHENCMHDHASHSHNHTEAAHSHAHEADEHNHHAHAHVENSDEIAFSDQKAKHFGVKTQKIAKGTFNDIIKVSGQIMPSQSDESVISAKSSGILKLNSNAIVGKQVGAGTSIGHISSQNVAGGDANEVARINFEAAKRELDRITPLYKDRIITEREYNQAKQTYDQAKAAMTGTNGAGSSATSNIAGTVTEVFVKDGEYVEVGATIAVVSKNARLILRADLPNRYASYIPNIKSANFRPAYTDKTYELSKLNGKLVSNKNLSVVTPGYIPVNFEFTNTESIIPGSFAEIYLLGSAKSNCLTLPVSAITEEEGYYFVYEKIHDEAYMKKEVKIGMNNGEQVEILSGINEGNEIVTEGAILIKLASQAGSVPGHTHDH